MSNAAYSHEQGTQDWIDARLGHITASRFADVKYGRNGEWSQTSQTYLLDLIGEHLTRQPASDVRTRAMDWGHAYEPVAREAFCEATGLTVDQCGFVKRPGWPLIGASPDGLIGQWMTLEIKCPMTASRHAWVLLNEDIPEEHVAQVQGQLWITGRETCHFVSFHPSFPAELQLAAVLVHRDQVYIDALQERVFRFRDQLVESLKAIGKTWREKQ